jgi:hypothetical protein
MSQLCHAYQSPGVYIFHYNEKYELSMGLGEKMKKK